MLDLRAGNKVTLSQLRTVIKNNGFVSKETQITARGPVSGEMFEVGATGGAVTVRAEASCERRPLAV